MFGSKKKEEEEEIKEEKVVEEEQTYSVDVFCGKDESNYTGLSREEADKLSDQIKDGLIGVPKSIGDQDLHVVVSKITSWQITEDDEEKDDDGESYY